jgi:two-component system, cell cycle sensor histidine kinase and response regulator CckA
MPDASRITVLLVDDNESLRNLIEELVADLGHTVLVASSAEEALDIVAEQGDRIRLLLTDILMPGIRGPDLAERIAATHPRIQAIFMSGSGPDAMADPGVIKAGGAVLQKPFTSEQLTTALQHALKQ